VSRRITAGNLKLPRFICILNIARHWRRLFAHALENAQQRGDRQQECRPRFGMTYWSEVVGVPLNTSTSQLPEMPGTELVLPYCQNSQVAQGLVPLGAPVFGLCPFQPGHPQRPLCHRAVPPRIGVGGIGVHPRMHGKVDRCGIVHDVIWASPAARGH